MVKCSAQGCCGFGWQERRLLQFWVKLSAVLKKGCGFQSAGAMVL